MKDEILKKLYTLADEKYKIFNANIIPTQQTIIGVRMPILKNICKDILKTNPIEFINAKKDDIYELIMLEGLVISNLNTNINEQIKYMYKFLDKIDNWALVDSFVISFKNIKNNEDIFLNIIDDLLKSNKEYFVRTALVILLSYYVKEQNLEYIFNVANNINDEKYYIFMANAWLISVCMAKYPQETIKFFKNNNLSKKTHNKAIQKSIESFRVSSQNKIILKSLRIKRSLHNTR